MAENVKLAENVILVDVAYFNDVVKDLKRYFELQLGRPLQNIYVEEWASYLALDSGVRDKDNNIEVLFVHDSQTNKLLHCDPSDLNKDLNGVGYTFSIWGLCSPQLRAGQPSAGKQGFAYSIMTLTLRL